MIPVAPLKFSALPIILGLKISKNLNNRNAKILSKGDIPAAEEAMSCPENSSITTSLGSLFLFFSIYIFVVHQPSIPVIEPNINVNKLH